MNVNVEFNEESCDSELFKTGVCSNCICESGVGLITFGLGLITGVWLIRLGLVVFIGVGVILDELDLVMSGSLEDAVAFDLD